MNAVTGIGPRTGTSWVMGKLKEAGLPIRGHQFKDELWVRKHNPQGYWDLDPREPIPTSGIVKLWGIWKYPQVHRVVVLERKDTNAQLRSMEKVFKDELRLEAWKDMVPGMLLPTEVLRQYSILTNAWLQTRNTDNTMTITTESLNDNIDRILSFLGKEL